MLAESRATKRRSPSSRWLTSRKWGWATLSGMSVDAFASDVRNGSPTAKGTALEARAYTELTYAPMHER